MPWSFSMKPWNLVLTRREYVCSTCINCFPEIVLPVEARCTQPLFHRTSLRTLHHFLAIVKTLSVYLSIATRQKLAGQEISGHSTPLCGISRKDNIFAVSLRINTDTLAEDASSGLPSRTSVSDRVSRTPGRQGFVYVQL